MGGQDGYRAMPHGLGPRAQISEAAAARYRELVDQAEALALKLERQPDDAALKAKLARVEVLMREAKGELIVSPSRVEILGAQAEEDPDRSLDALLDALAEQGNWGRVVEEASQEIQRLQALPKQRQDKARIAALVARHNGALDRLGKKS